MPSSLSIPGYQPVENLGKTPSFGFWIRAIQTRMDRGVLLKLLPPGAPALHEFFDREISTMVRSEGHGVLRVIDEGTLTDASGGSLRFMVLDEANGKPVEEGAGLSAAELSSLRQHLETLHREVRSRGQVLLPIPVSSFRRLPSGDLFAADVGWIVPVAKRIPSHPRIPKPLLGEAKPGHSARFLAATLRDVIEWTGSAVPKPLERWLRELDSTPLEAELPEFASTVESPSWIRNVILATVGLLLLVVGAGFAFHILDDPSNESGPTASGGPERAASESAIPTAAEREEAEARAEGVRREEERLAREAAEAEAWGALAEVLGDEDPAAACRGEAGLDAAALKQLARIVDEHGDTESARVAALVLRASAVHAAIGPATRFRPVPDRVRSLIEAGELAAAEDLLAEAERSVVQETLDRDGARPPDGWENWTLVGRSVPVAGYDGPDVDSCVVALDEAERDLGRVGVVAAGGYVARFDALREELRAASDRRLEAVRAEVARLRPLRAFKPIFAALDAAASQLIAEDRVRLEETRREVSAEAKDYVRDARALRTAIDDSIRLAAEGNWRAAIETLESRAETEFADLVEDRTAWGRRFRVAERAATQLTRALEKRDGGDNFSYELYGEEERLRGKVVEVARGPRWSVKIQGSRQTRELSPVEVTVEQLARLCSEETGTAIATEDWLLMQFFLGARDRAITAAAALPARPEWLDAAQLRLAKRQREVLEARIGEARERAEAGDWAAVREIALELRRTQPESSIERHRARLRGWIDRYYAELGPGNAFPGAVSSSWNPETRELVLDYDFDEGGDDDWDDVQVDRFDELDLRKGRVQLRGSMLLAPGGETEIFRGALRVDVLVRPLNREAPNLNLVLWSRAPFEKKHGVVGGLGFKPRDISVIEDDEGRRTLLPATVLGRLADAEDGYRGHRLAVLSDRKERVGASKFTLRLADDGAKTELAVLSSSQFAEDDGLGKSWEGKSLPGSERRGTVEVRTYGSGVEVWQVHVKGTVDPAWWTSWRTQRVTSEIGE